MPSSRLLLSLLLVVSAGWVAPTALAQCRSAGVSSLPMPAVDWQRSWVAELRGPLRLALDPAGRVAIADPARRRIDLRGADGALAGSISLPGRPVAVAADAFGGYWVGDADAGRVLRVEADGRVATMLGIGDGEFGRPGDIAIDVASGEIYVSDSDRHHVRVYSAGGVLLRTIGAPSPADDSPARPGEFRTPTGVALAGDELLVADPLNFRIQAFDKQSGAFRYCLGTFRASSFFPPNSGPARSFGMAQGLEVDAGGRLYVVDAFQGQVVVVDRSNGAVIGRIGAFGEGPGQLRVPSDAVIDGAGRLVVANTDGARLELFSLDGAPELDTVIPARARLTLAEIDRARPPGLVDIVLSVPGYRAADVAPDSIRVGGQPAALVEVGEFDGDSVGDLRAVFDASALLATLPLGAQRVAVTAAIGSLEARASVPLTITDSSTGRDADGDGVPDATDACPATPAGSVVDGAGCAVAQRCPCVAARNHGQHQQCVEHVAKDLLRDGRIDQQGFAALVRDAARSTCGRKP